MGKVYDDDKNTKNKENGAVFKMPYSGYFPPESNFCQFCQLVPLAKILLREFSLCINYIVDAATITVLAKNSYNTRVLALAKTFSHEIYLLYGI